MDNGEEGDRAERQAKSKDWSKEAGRLGEKEEEGRQTDRQAGREGKEGEGARTKWMAEGVGRRGRRREGKEEGEPLSGEEPEEEGMEEYTVIYINKHAAHKPYAQGGGVGRGLSA